MNNLGLDIVFTLSRMLIWTVFAWSGGIALSLVLSRRTFHDKAILLIIHFLRQISPFAWLPLAIIVVGIGEAPIGVVMVAAMLFPAIFSMVEFYRSLPHEYHEEAQICGATHWQYLFKICLPLSKIHIIMLLRQLWSIGWQTIIAAEMLGVSVGLGFRLLDFRYLIEYKYMTFYLIIIGIYGVAFDYILSIIQDKMSCAFSSKNRFTNQYL